MRWPAFRFGLNSDEDHRRRVIQRPRTTEGRLPQSQFLLKLYVSGTSSRTELAVANLRRICEAELNGRYELEIIDVVKQPQVAEDAKVLATPTLIKHLPLPIRRVIGDLSDRERVLLGLDILPMSPETSRPEGSTDG